MKNKNLIYIALGGIGLYYLYSYYQKNKSKVALTAAPVILNVPNYETPAEQTAPPVISEADKAAYNVKYKLSGVKFRLPQTL
jgi:hypothetical protein